MGTGGHQNRHTYATALVATSFGCMEWEMELEAKAGAFPHHQIRGFISFLSMAFSSTYREADEALNFLARVTFPCSCCDPRSPLPPSPGSWTPAGVCRCPGCKPYQVCLPPHPSMPRVPKELDNPVAKYTMLLQSEVLLLKRKLQQTNCMGRNLCEVNKNEF